MLEEQSDHKRTLLHHDPMIWKMPYIYKLICEKRLYFFTGWLVLLKLLTNFLFGLIERFLWKRVKWNWKGIYLPTILRFVIISSWTKKITEAFKKEETLCIVVALRVKFCLKSYEWTAQPETDLFITSMIKDRNGRHEVLLSIN